MLRDDAYVSFKQSLFDERIRPGQFLSQRELCEKLGVSFGPLRDALKQLAGERLIELLPQRGVRIVTVDEKFIREAFQVRRCLEVETCRILTVKGWERLDEIERRTESVIQRAVNNVIDGALLAEAYEVDWLLHNSMIAALGNDLLQEIHSNNSDKIRIIRLNARFSASRVVPAMNEHLAIIRAMIAGDAEAAAKALCDHLAVSEQRALGREPGLV